MARDPAVPIQPAIACDLTAIAAADRAQHVALSQQLMSSLAEVRERPDGYALRFPVTSALIEQIGAFIVNERLCCPFLHFTLEIAPYDAALWLHLTGGQGVKEVLAAEFSDLIHGLL